MMKKQLLGFMIVTVCNGMYASETPQKTEQVGQVFDQGMLTYINGNNLYAYLHGKILHQPYPEFKDIRVFEFIREGHYIDHGSLRTLRAHFPQSKPSKRNSKRYRELGFMDAKLENKSTKDQRTETCRMIEDFAGTNEAVYCDGLVSYFNRDGEKRNTGIVVLGSQKLDHCEYLKEHYQQFMSQQNS